MDTPAIINKTFIKPLIHITGCNRVYMRIRRTFISTERQGGT